MYINIYMCTHLFIVYAFDLFHLDLSTKKGSPMQQVVASGCPGPNIISAKGTRHCGRCPDGGSSRWEYDHPQKNNDFCHCHKRKRTFMAANHVWGLEFGWNVQEVKICFIFFYGPETHLSFQETFRHLSLSLVLLDSWPLKFWSMVCLICHVHIPSWSSGPGQKLNRCVGAKPRKGAYLSLARQTAKQQLVIVEDFGVERWPLRPDLDLKMGLKSPKDRHFKGTMMIVNWILGYRLVD